LKIKQNERKPLFIYIYFVFVFIFKKYFLKVLIIFYNFRLW